jgi:hypothetical protein
VASRIDSAADFLGYLDALEEELTAPETDTVEDPAEARKGDKLPGGFVVERRLGKGATATALVVAREGQEFVLKVPNTDEFAEHVRGEGEVLAKLRHQRIVEYVETLILGGKPCLLLRSAGPETLGERLRKEGRLHVDLLQRFGEDLLEILVYLDENGIPHRDIKPDNIGVGPGGRGGYVAPTSTTSVSVPSRLATRPPAIPDRDPRQPLAPEEADARQFEEKLKRSLKEGAFLTLLVARKGYAQVRQKFEQQFPIEVLDGDRLLIDALREAAARARVDWSVVLRTDAAPHNGDWNKLLLLVGRALPAVEARLMSSDATVLLLHPGLLARYDRLDLLERLRDRVGRPGGPKGLWLLLPLLEPKIDGKAVPLLTPAQRVHVPESWVARP